MKAVTHGIQFSHRGIAVVLKDADKRCNTDAAYQLVLGVFYKIGTYVLVIDHGIYPEIIGGLEAEITQRIITFVTGAHKNAGLIRISKRYIVSCFFAAAGNGEIIILRKAGIPEHVLVIVVGIQQF